MGFCRRLYTLPMAHVLLIEEISMKTIQIPDEYDMRAEVNNVLSCAYEGKDWCEDGSIRQDIIDLKSNIVDLDDDIDKLDDKIKGILICIKTLNEMVEIISKRVGLDDESE